MPRREFQCFLVLGAELPAVVFVGVEPMLWSKVVAALGRAIREKTGKPAGFRKGHTSLTGDDRDGDPRTNFMYEWTRGKWDCIHIKEDGSYEWQSPKTESDKE